MVLRNKRKERWVLDACKIVRTVVCTIVYSRVHTTHTPEPVHTNNKTKFLTVRRTPHATLVLAKLMPNGMNFTGDKSRCFWRPSAQDVRSRS